MDITFRAAHGTFNFRVCAMIIHEGRILAMSDENSPYFYLPGGRVKMNETVDAAVLREVREELQIEARNVRPLWFNQGFFVEDLSRERYHEVCVYFLMDVSDTALLSRGDRFTLQEGGRTHEFEWLKFERLKDEYFYPVFLKESIFHLPDELTVLENYDLGVGG